MPHHTRLNPANANQIGPSAPDSTTLSEFTFHHGHVDQVFNVPLDVEFTKGVGDIPNNESQIIIVTPTFEGVVNSNWIKSTITCQPLLRGFSDSIATGDSVIYTQIGEIFYYLGPLNTTNNPNYTPDQFWNSQQNEVVKDDRKLDINGYNVNYIPLSQKKAFKEKVYQLDRPLDTGIGDIGSNAEIESAYSDMSLEGRHNNFIRIGSRFVNPHIIIKNNSSGENNGSVFGMLSIGSILENGIRLTDLSVDALIDKEKSESKEGYIGEYIGVGNDSTDVEGIPRQDRFNKNFGSIQSNGTQTEFDQIIMFSDKITFDAQNNDLTMSALRNINVGSGQNISITSKKHTLIQSENIYLGKQSKQKTEPMVLGDKLKEVLETIVKILNDARVNVQGVPFPLVNQSLGELTDLSNLTDELINLNPQEGGMFLSKHHYIEQNRSTNEG